jgi:hypothetical protein
VYSSAMRLGSTTSEVPSSMIDEAVRAVELEAELERVHQVEDGDVVLAVAQVLERVAEKAWGR